LFGHLKKKGVSMVRVLVLVAALAALFVSPAALQSQERPGDAWITLAIQTVDPAGRSARFDVSRTKGRSKAIRVSVRQGAVIVERVVVTYANGQVFYGDLERPVSLRNGQSTAAFDLRYEERFIDTVDFAYRVEGRPAGPIQIEVQALQTPAGKLVERSVSTPTVLAGRPTVTNGEGGAKSAERAASPVARKDEPAPVAAAPPPPAARSRSITRSAPTPGGEASAPRSAAAAADDKPYATVELYFGTDRKQEANRQKWERQLAAFGTRPGGKLILGKAAVTVPKQGRSAGQISTNQWDFIVTRFSLRNEDLARDFTIFSVDTLDQATFASQVQKKREASRRYAGQAFVFVHGFNVSFDDALFRAAQITFDVDFDGVPFVFSWPSVAGLSGYILDRTRAQGAEESLRQFIELIERDTGATQIHLIAHSMGSDPLLRVLRSMSTETAAAGTLAARRPRFGEVILAAPDVTREIFSQAAGRIKPLAKGMTLYASSNDWALRVSRELLRGENPAGWVPAEGPLVISGIDTIDVSRASTDFFNLNHTTFAERELVLKDLGGLLENGKRPPSTRLSAYRAVASPAGSYWRFEP
jgi:esterase/lipase superfamily enzyme